MCFRTNRISNGNCKEHSEGQNVRFLTLLTTVYSQAGASGVYENSARAGEGSSAGVV